MIKYLYLVIPYCDWFCVDCNWYFIDLSIHPSYYMGAERKTPSGRSRAMGKHTSRSSYLQGVSGWVSGSRHQPRVHRLYPYLFTLFYYMFSVIWCNLTFLILILYCLCFFIFYELILNMYKVILAVYSCQQHMGPHLNSYPCFNPRHNIFNCI